MKQTHYTLIAMLFFVSLLSFSCSPQSKDSTDQKQTETIDPELASLNEQIAAEPERHYLYHQRALTYLKLNMPYEALSDINKALQLDPQNTEYTITMGDIYFTMGHIENCRKALITAQDNDPSNVEPILKLAELDLILKDYEKMNLYLDKVLKIDQNNAQAYFMRGIALKEQGDTLKAMKLLMQATSLDPEYFEAFVEAGILFSLKHDPLAIDFLNTAINLKPMALEPRYALAMFYQEHDKLNEAMKEYYTILNIDKKYAPAHYNLGYIHLVYLKVYDQAIKHFSDAIAVQPNYAEAYYNRGYCFELKGDIEAARRDYQEALAIKNNYALAIDGLNRLDRMIEFE